MTGRITPRDLAQMKADSGSWTSYDVLRLIREVELLTEERDEAKRGLADQITARKAADLEADTILMSNGALTEETLRQRADNEKLRAALRDWLKIGKAIGYPISEHFVLSLIERTRAALGSTEDSKKKE